MSRRGHKPVTNEHKIQNSSTYIPAIRTNIAIEAWQWRSETCISNIELLLLLCRSFWALNKSLNCLFSDLQMGRVCLYENYRRDISWASSTNTSDSNTWITPLDRASHSLSIHRICWFVCYIIIQYLYASCMAHIYALQTHSRSMHREYYSAPARLRSRIMSGVCTLHICLYTHFTWHCD